MNVIYDLSIHSFSQFVKIIAPANLRGDYCVPGIMLGTVPTSLDTHTHRHIFQLIITTYESVVITCIFETETSRK